MVEGRETLELLYGSDPRPGLVGVAPDSAGISLWWRQNGALLHEQITFRPFFLTSHPHLLDDLKPEAEISELTGENLYSHRITCSGWEHYDAALKHIMNLYRQQRSDFEYEPYLRFSDPINLYLLASGCTHYKEMNLAQVNVMYVAVRAVGSGGADYADPQEKADKVILAGLSDGRDYHRVLRLEDGDEAGLIERVCGELVTCDPDVIVGHDLFKGAVDYLYQRARRYKLKLNWGRDNGLVRVRKSRAPAAEKQLEYPRADAAGRSFIDTWFLAQYFDVVKRDLARFDAPYVARYLDPTCQLPDAVPAWDVEQLWQTKPDLLVADVRYELDAARVIFQTLAGSYFAQAQILPLSFQDCVVRGNGVKINNLMMREYLRRGVAIPEPAEARSFAGGYTEIRQTGLIRNVLNVDVASLYPSIMLSHGVKPDSDTSDVFQPMLHQLTAERLQAKQLAQCDTDPYVRMRADARQAAMKIFINSFFGYLGTNRMNWADPLKAEFITNTGQQIVQQLAQLIEDEGGAIIEIDTDGVYFSAPEGCDSLEDYQRLVKRVSEHLPDGINIELGGYFPAMLSHKVKNYALLDDSGNITVKGSGLKSRGLEPFLHNFIAYSLSAILHDYPERINVRYDELQKSIRQQAIDIKELAKTDTLIESLESYKEKVAGGKRNRAAVYEIALSAKRPLRPGDQVSYYITGEKATVTAFEAAKPLRQFDPANPDINVKYYLKKLEQNLKKVRGYIPASSPTGKLFRE